METSGATATAYGVARRAKWIVEVRILVYVKFDCRKKKVDAGLKGFEPRTLSVSMASCRAHNCAGEDALRS